VEKAIYKIFDYEIAFKIDKEMLICINMLETCGKGLVDFADGRTFYGSALKTG